MLHSKRIISAICIALAVVLCIGGVAFATSWDNAGEAENDIKMVDSFTLSDVKSIDDVKENIYNNMLNSVDFYDAVEGSFTTTFIRAGEEVTIDYAVDIPAQVASESVKGSIEDIQQVCIDETVYTYDADRQIYTHDYYASQLDTSSRSAKLDYNACLPHAQKMTFFDGEKAIYDRVVELENGERGYYYRPDITNTAFACTSIFPQSLGMALLTDMDNWEISSVVRYLGRQAVVITRAVKDDDYAQKISSDYFTMTVDMETGVLLDFKGYSDSGVETQSITTRSISFVDSGANNGIKLAAQSVVSAMETTEK